MTGKVMKPIGRFYVFALRNSPDPPPPRHLRQIHDEVVGVGLLRSADDVLHGDAGSTVAYILSDGGGEQHGLLLHDANQRAQPLDVQPSDVMSVQGHLRWTAQSAGFAKIDG